MGNKTSIAAATTGEIKREKNGRDTANANTYLISHKYFFLNYREQRAPKEYSTTFPELFCYGGGLKAV